MKFESRFAGFESPWLRRVGKKVKDVGGVNLAQGLCIMPVPDLVLEAARESFSLGHNLYSAAEGVSELREAVASRLRNFNALDFCADEIIVTAGSTGAFEAVLNAYLKPEDEVVSFIPFYPYHRNAMLRHGVVTKYVQLTPPDWKFSMDEFRKCISDRTKVVLLTTPNNPTGKIFSESELKAIAEVCIENNLLCVTDEVYEYLSYDGNHHISMASLPGMRERTITMSSYSKTFAITGWRIGYLAAPKELVEPMIVVNDQVYICAPTPLQHAVAKGIRELPSTYYSELNADYERKCDILMEGLKLAGFEPRKPEGAYYLLGHTNGRFPGKTSEEVALEMISKVGVAAVPATDFIGPEAGKDPAQSTFMRFCYALPDEMLEDAVQRLKSL